MGDLGRLIGRYVCGLYSLDSFYCEVGEYHYNLVSASFENPAWILILTVIIQAWMLWKRNDKRGYTKLGRKKDDREIKFIVVWVICECLFVYSVGSI